MDNLIHNITGDWLHLAITSILSVLSLFFIWQVFTRGIWLIFKLRHLRAQVRSLSNHDPQDIKRALTQVFERTRWLEQWQEYEETLHEQLDTSRPESRVTTVRATAPADAFFHSDVLVDGTLHIEFYKHLPGILTGLGIIATFGGLITGLQQFDASASDPEALKNSLGGLFGYVRDAFWFSAIAISLAMIFTVIEKAIYAICLRHAAAVTMEVDRLFDAGVGEEYLSKLVRSSEDGATQTKQLKESLVEDLKALLTNLTERQIQATQQLSADLGTSIQQSLETPLRKIAESVATTTQGQSEQSARLLEDLMASFVAQMRETLGGQLHGLGDMMQQTSRAIGQVEAALRGLVADMERASQASSSGVQTAMKDLLQSLADHQRQQGEVSAAHQATALGAMQEAIVRLADAHEASAQRAHEAAQVASERISGAAEGAIKSSHDSMQAARELLAGIGQVSTEAIKGLEHGAGKVGSVLASVENATDRLDRAGHSLAGLHEKSIETTRSLERASNVLGTGAQAVAEAMAAMDRASGRFEGVSGLVASEAQVREATLQRIHEVMHHSKQASEQFGELARNVENHLGNGVERFGDATVKVLNDVLKQYDNSLGGSVSMLKDAMGELAMLVSSVSQAQRR